MKIENGSVGYAGSASFTVTGKVGDNGAVTVVVARGNQVSQGPGQAVQHRRLGHCGPRLRASARVPGRPSAAAPKPHPQLKFS